MKNGITVAYSGVHQAYQLALAAEELGYLDTFFCSVFAANGKWGGVLTRLLGDDALLNRRVNGLSLQKVRENPWPLLTHYCRARFRPKTRDDWLQANASFDHWVAEELKCSNAALFIGVETCTAESFAVARERGMIRILDSPQVHPTFLENVLAAATDDLSLPWSVWRDTEEMQRRKQIEIELADCLLTLSEVHTRSFTNNGISPERVVEIPLWADPMIWYQPQISVRSIEEGLRVLFVGGISLRKGIPYLLTATRRCGHRICLKMVGSPSDDIGGILKDFRDSYSIVPSMSKTELRECYWHSDVLVLPSLVDSFGFVAMEAMACGLPAIVTENCGVPVPDPSWRVPVMDSDAIAERLTLYAQDRDLCREHGLLAAEFARQYTPKRYREQIKELYRKLLGLPSASA